MAKIEWVHHRLERWSMWRASGGRSGGGIGMHPMFKGYSPAGGVAAEPQVPINDLECAETELSIKALPAQLGETVASYYLQDSDRCRRRMCISSSTLSQRIDEAHRQLAQAWAQVKNEAVDVHQPPHWIASGSFTR
jgi:hypothetical protein